MMKTHVRNSNGVAWRGGSGAGMTRRRESRCINMRRTVFTSSGGIGTGVAKFAARKQVISSYEVTAVSPTARNFGETYKNSCVFSWCKSLKSPGLATSLVESFGFTAGCGKILATLTMPRMATVIFFLCLLLQSTRPISAAFTTGNYYDYYDAPLFHYLISFIIY